MRALKVLIRSLVRTFYQANIGFFLVVVFMAFFLMRGQEHVALASNIATSLSLTLLTLVLWTVYWIKAIGFVYKTINTSSYLFIRQLSHYPKSKQFIGLFTVLYIIGEPAWAYAMFISFFNFKYETYGLFTLMMVFLLAANTLATLAVMQVLKHPIREQLPGLWHRYISKRFSLPYSFWYVRHLLVHEPMLAFLSKAGSLILLLATFYLFETDVYDWRLLAIGSLFSFTINSMLIYHYFEFEKANNWVYNIPRTRIQIIMTALIVQTIFFVPEIILMSFHISESISITEWSGLLLFQTALSYFLYSSLYFSPITKGAFGKRIFYLIVLFVFIILYGMPMLLVNFLLFSFGIWSISNYYKFSVKSI